MSNQGGRECWALSLACRWDCRTLNWGCMSRGRRGPAPYQSRFAAGTMRLRVVDQAVGDCRPEGPGRTRSGLECGAAGDGDLDLGAEGGSAENPEFCADPVGPLAHPLQTPMSAAAERSGIDATPVVANHEP